MSKTPAETARRTQVISLDAILARLDELRNYIAALQTQVNNLTQELTELQLALSSMRSLDEVKSDTDVLIALDRLGAVLVPGRISPSWKDRVLVNIGGNYYARVDRSVAEKIISRRIGSVQNVLRLRQQELNRAINEYNYLQQIVAAAIMRQQAQMRRAEEGGTGG